MAFYTLVFNFNGGTFVYQLRLGASDPPDVEELVDSWLQHLERDTVEVAGSALTLMEYLDSLLDATFAEQIREDLEIREDIMTPLDNLEGVWYVSWVFDLGPETSVDFVDPELVGFGELHVIRSTEPE